MQGGQPHAGITPFPEAGPFLFPVGCVESPASPPLFPLAKVPAQPAAPDLPLGTGHVHCPGPQGPLGAIRLACLAASAQSEAQVPRSSSPWSGMRVGLWGGAGRGVLPSS